MFIFHLTLIQQGNIFKTRQSEEHCIPKPKMRAEDLRVMMTEGEEGDLYRETTTKTNKKHTDTETEKWQDKTDDRNNWHKESDDKLERLEGTTQVTKTAHLTCHHLNLNDYLLVLPGNKEKCDLVQARYQRESVINRWRKNLLPWEAARKLGYFSIIILFWSSFYWCFPWSLYLHSFPSERALTGQIGSILLIMVPETPFSVITQANLTICWEELVFSCYILHFGVQLCLDSRPHEFSEVTSTFWGKYYGSEGIKMPQVINYNQCSRSAIFREKNLAISILPPDTHCVA